MQIITVFPGDADTYRSQDLARRAAPPGACPHCQARACLEALGYYQRNVTDRAARVLRLAVRRFRCRACGKTASLLPAFAQPYRLIHNGTIQRYFAGPRHSAEVAPWRALLRRYWRRFGRWVARGELARRGAAGPGLPSGSAQACWRATAVRYSDLAAATRHLVTRFQITLFGRYRCHCPNVLC